MNSPEPLRLNQMLTTEHETVDALTTSFNSIGAEVRGELPCFTNLSPDDRF
jgi:hypothetical protein